MMQTLKLYNKESKVTTINMLKILLIKVDNMQDQMGSFSRIENFKEELSINAKTGKLFNRDEKCLQRPVSTLDTIEERISELKDWS